MGKYIYIIYVIISHIAAACSESVAHSSQSVVKRSPRGLWSVGSGLPVAAGRLVVDSGAPESVVLVVRYGS